MSDEPLADECVVVRGGLLEVRSLEHSVDVCAARLGFFGLSLWGENGFTFEETCRRARLRNLVVRVSTVGLLRELGHEPYRSGRSPHLTIEFDRRPTDDELRAVAAAFDQPVRNPHPAG